MKKIERPNGNIRVQSVNTIPSRTQPQFKAECDINNIMKKYKVTGSITHLNNKQRGTYLDLTNLPDYQQSLNDVIQANEAFSALPSHVRKQFENDPIQLINFLSDTNNREEAIRLGLIDKPTTTNSNNDDIIKTPTPNPSSPS